MNLTINTRIGEKVYTIGYPLMIAEIGVNHENSIEKALLMIDECAEMNIPAVKFQTYKANKIAAAHSPSYWDLSMEKTSSQRELFKKYDSFGFDEYKKLADYTYKKGLIFMSTPFDIDSVNMLDPLLDIYKISSSDITNYPLIIEIAKKEKPIILSCGASTHDEIKKALEFIKKYNKNQVTLLHCILNYPTKDTDAEISQIITLKSVFKENIIGYSDHTLPDKNLTSLKLAHSIGAIAIEKHYTFDKNLPGNDHYHAFDKNDARSLMADFKKIGTLYGQPKLFNLKNQTQAIKNARRAIYAKSDIKEYEILTEENIIMLRPAGDFIESSDFEKIIGKRVNRNIKKDEGIRWENIYEK